jgi:hypothetical protein
VSGGFYIILKSSSGLLDGEMKVILFRICGLVGADSTIDFDIILSLWFDTEVIEGIVAGFAGEIIEPGDTVN